MNNYFNETEINKYFPNAKMIPSMDVWKIPEHKIHSEFPRICNGNDYFLEIKKDGYWYEFEKTKDGNCYLFSRNVSTSNNLLTEKSKNVPHIIKYLNELLPAGTIIVGEIYYPGKESKDVTKIMGCLPDKAIDRQKDNLIHYYIHDILMYKNIELIKLKAIERYRILSKILNKDRPEYIELAQAWEDNLQDRTAEALDSGEEGVVLKRKDAPYTPDKRPAWDTIKVKKVDTIDAIIISTLEPTKYYQGSSIEDWIYWEVSPNHYKEGNYFQQSIKDSNIKPITKPFFKKWKTAISIGAYDENGKIIEIGSVSSGLTDEMRENLAKCPENYIGKVCEIQCMEKNTSDHTVRHPFFKRIREDKDAEKCLIKDIF